VVQQLNSARGTMRGFNTRPLPSGEVSVHSNGNVTVTAAGGRTYEVRGNGTLLSYKSTQHFASFRRDGGIGSLHTAGIDIRHAANGAKTIVTRRPDRSIIVSTGRHSGYLERTVNIGNRTVTQRTFVMGNQTYQRVYTSYTYRGLVLEHYVPAYYYAPAFYGWAYYPWGAPARYAWGWTAEPWYQSSGNYFSTDNSYSSALSWLTDFMLGRTMAASYEQRPQPGEDGYREQFVAGNDSGEPDETVYAPADTPITAELKAEVAQQVQQQIAFYNAASTGEKPSEVGELPSAMKPKHVFVVANSMDVITAEQQACSLSPGDMLRLAGSPSADSPLANLTVASSRRADCPAGAEVIISMQDLQDMQNNLRAGVDDGLAALRSIQGTSGLPSAPSDAVAPPPRPVMADAPRDGATNVASLLDSQRQQASQTESSILQMAFDSPHAQP
jgi:hypothetical protein